MPSDQKPRSPLSWAVAVLFVAHVCGVALPDDDPSPWRLLASTAAGILGVVAVPAFAWMVVRWLDRGIGRLLAFGLRGGLVRLALGVIGLVPAALGAGRLLAAGLPSVTRNLVEVALALGFVVGLILSAIALADLLFRTTAPFKHLATRLMVLLAVAAIGNVLWVGLLGVEMLEIGRWVVARGHLSSYAEGFMALAGSASDRWGGVVGAFVLSLPLTLLLAWRFAQNATRGLSVLQEGFARVARGELEAGVPVEGNDEVAAMQRSFNQMLVAARDRRFLETAFSRYVSPVVLDRLRRRTDGTVRVPGERRVATVLFSDIRGFTALSSTLLPEEIIAVLNIYMSRMIDTVARYDGYINKFVGDAIMVVWNAPLDQARHALRALACAQAMQAELQRANAEKAFGPHTLAMGIGINTGPLVAGNLGNQRQLEFTVIGDAVNVASRACSHAAGGQVAITRPVLESVVEAGEGSVVQCESLGLVELKGKGEVELWALSTPLSVLDAALSRRRTASDVRPSGPPAVTLPPPGRRPTSPGASARPPSGGAKKGRP